MKIIARNDNTKITQLKQHLSKYFQTIDLVSQILYRHWSGSIKKKLLWFLERNVLDILK